MLFIHLKMNICTENSYWKVWRDKNRRKIFYRG